MIDIACIISAFCFFMSNALGLAAVVNDRNRPYYMYETFLKLDPDYIQLEWENRRSNAGLLRASGLFNAVAWFLLAMPIIQLAWILSRSGKRQVGLHVTIACLALTGAIVEIMSKLLVLGGWNVCQWISLDFNLESWTSTGSDKLGWRVLELTYLVTQGLTVWADAFEWIAIFGIMVLIYYSVGTTPENKQIFGKPWPTLGLVIAFLSFIDFAADILRLEEWITFTIVALIVSVINTVFLLPVWVIMMGRVLPKSMPPYVEHGEDGVHFTSPHIDVSFSPTSSSPPPALFRAPVGSSSS